MPRRKSSGLVRCLSKTQALLGGDPQRARGADRGGRSYRVLEGATLGRPRAGVRRAAGRPRRNRTAARRHSLAALSRPLSAADGLSGRDAICNSFRPTASRTRRSQTKTHNKNKKPFHPISRPSLAQALEADISTWQKTGHFYFALTAVCFALPLFHRI